MILMSILLKVCHAYFSRVVREEYNSFASNLEDEDN